MWLERGGAKDERSCGEEENNMIYQERLRVTGRIN